MPLRCWKSEGSRVIRLRTLILLTCLLILSFWACGGRTMTDGEIKEMRYEREYFLRLPS